MNKKRTRQIKDFIAALAQMRRFIHEQRLFFSKKTKFTPQQLEIMSLLAGGRRSVKEIANFFNISSSAATQMIESLVKSRSISRRLDRKDRRIVRLALTATGRKKLQQLQKSHLRHMQLALRELNDKEMEILAELPNKLIKQFKKLNINS